MNIHIKTLPIKARLISLRDTAINLSLGELAALYCVSYSLLLFATVYNAHMHGGTVNIAINRVGGNIEVALDYLFSGFGVLLGLVILAKKRAEARKKDGG